MDTAVHLYMNLTPQEIITVHLSRNKVKLFLYRPGKALRAPRGEGFQKFCTTGTCRW